jgi:hypothetical protein
VAGEPNDDREPRIRISKAGWRVAAAVSICVSICLVAVLLAQAGLFDRSATKSDHPNGLTTLALVLAVMAFFIQIFVFMFQIIVGSRSEVRGEQLHSKTQQVLDKIAANSDATQKVLFSQFDRLLDYVVGSPPEHTDIPVEASESEEEDGDATPETEPITRAQVDSLIRDAVAQLSLRPTFSAERQGDPDPENKQILEFLISWPDRREAPAAVKKLRALSPLALSALTSYASFEILQRQQRRPIGITSKKGKNLWLPADELLQNGLLHRNSPTSYGLTEEGRALSRFLPTPKKSPRPDWINEALEPLTKADK